MIDIQKMIGARIPGVEIEPNLYSDLIKAATGIRPDQIPSLSAVLGLKLPEVLPLSFSDPRIINAPWKPAKKGN